MDNLDWKAMTEDDIVLHFKPMIAEVLNSCFGNHREYMRVHMFSYEDLEQFGMIGIMEAIRTFDESKNTKFKTHVVNRIKFALINYSKEVSLRNKNNYSSELIDMVSLNDEIGGEDGSTIELLSQLSTDTCDYEKLESDLFIRNAILKLHNDKNISKEYVAFLILKMKGYSTHKIAVKFNTTSYYVEAILKKFKQQTLSSLELEESLNELK